MEEQLGLSVLYSHPARPLPVHFCPCHELNGDSCICVI